MSQKAMKSKKVSVVKPEPDSVDALLAEYPDVFEEGDRGKLRCTLTKHECMPNDLANYIKTKKFQGEWQIHQIMQKYGEYFEVMREGILACRLTLRSLTRDGKAMERHVNGSRFLKALAIQKEKDEKEKQSSSDQNGGTDVEAGSTDTGKDGSIVAMDMNSIVDAMEDDEEVENRMSEKKAKKLAKKKAKQEIAKVEPEADDSIMEDQSEEHMEESAKLAKTPKKKKRGSDKLVAPALKKIKKGV
ncbi:surfeit locus protein 2 (SURF2) domain-containing protein [Ditylenchus destructor]|uniref:Surfeit locus protein 2 (SURF2) domain-containing protein n=1 Tax=Ditylenchus destructor TaxID=166010 RepID=A0AAD4MWB6_9BILA|nr:surfeit locus protein 2 (SURF2) domain-containing protein [Ditylenchus destructor]